MAANGVLQAVGVHTPQSNIEKTWSKIGQIWVFRPHEQRHFYAKKAETEMRHFRLKHLKKEIPLGTKDLPT